MIHKNEAKKTRFYSHFLKNFLAGLVIGIASITPGISAGVIVAAAGFYEPIVHALANFPKECRKSIGLLLPLGLGAGVGILLFSRVMQELMIAAESLVLYLFMGLVVGSIPALFKEANRGGFRKRFFGATFLAFAFVFVSGQLVADLPRETGSMELDVVTMLLCGAVLAFGSVIPGVSSSLILIQLGVYRQLLTALTAFNLRTLALVGVGFVVTTLLMLKIVDFLFRQYRGFAYYGVIGFLGGSLVMVFPGLRTGTGLLMDLVFFLAGTALSWGSMRWRRSD